MIALIAGNSSLLFLVHACSVAQQTKKAEMRQRQANAVHYKKQEELHAQILRCRDALRANLAWITSDDFWRVHETPEHEYQYGLRNLIGDKSCEVKPLMKAYVLKKFPIYGNSFFSEARFPREELVEIIVSQSYSAGVGTRAKQNLESKKYIQVGNVNSTSQSGQRAPHCTRFSN